jgi:hypothetical protein
MVKPGAPPGCSGGAMTVVLETARDRTITTSSSGAMNPLVS